MSIWKKMFQKDVGNRETPTNEPLSEIKSDKLPSKWGDAKSFSGKTQYSPPPKGIVVDDDSMLSDYLLRIGY